jgi:hypothetical protein
LIILLLRVVEVAAAVMEVTQLAVEVVVQVAIVLVLVLLLRQETHLPRQSVVVAQAGQDKLLALKGLALHYLEPHHFLL